MMSGCKTEKCPKCRNEVQYDEQGIGFCGHCEHHVSNHTISWVVFCPRTKEELYCTAMGLLASEAGTKHLATLMSSQCLIGLIQDFFTAVKGHRIIKPGERGYKKGSKCGVAELAALNDFVTLNAPPRKMDMPPEVNTFTAYCYSEEGKKRWPGLLLKPSGSLYWQQYVLPPDGKWIASGIFDTGTIVDWQNAMTPASILKLIKDGIPTQRIY
jgi:hypothetical protein